MTFRFWLAWLVVPSYPERKLRGKGQILKGKRDTLGVKRQDQKIGNNLFFPVHAVKRLNLKLSVGYLHLEFQSCTRPDSKETCNATAKYSRVIIHPCNIYNITYIYYVI